MAQGKGQATAIEPGKNNPQLLSKLQNARQTSAKLSIPVNTLPVDTPIPLSFTQRGIWFLQQYQSDSARYHIPCILRLEGKLNVPALEQAINLLINRHEILRARILHSQGKPRFVIAEAEIIPLPAIANLPVNLQSKLDLEAKQAFDLALGPLLRCRLLKLDEEQHVLQLTLHHIIADGWSLDILLNELASLYNTCCRGVICELPPLRLQYRDFCLWQQQRLRGPLLEKLLTYWQKQLAGAPCLALPLDRARPQLPCHSGRSYQFTLNKSITAQANKLALQQGGSLFMVLLAAFQILLSRYTNQQDILIGTPVAARNRPELEPLVGLFSNILVIRTYVEDKLSFLQYLERVKQVVLDADEHQELPFEQLMANLHHQAAKQPLVQVTFSFQVESRFTHSFKKLRTKRLQADTHTAKFDLGLSLSEHDGELTGNIEYADQLFDKSRIRRMAGHFTCLMEGIICDPDIDLSRLNLLTQKERQQQLIDWRNSTFTPSLCIHQKFEAQVDRTPNFTALVSDADKLSYRELNQKANRLAHQLRSIGIGSLSQTEQPVVAIISEPSPELVIGLIAILKAGAAYLPLDPNLPPQRLEFILSDCQPSAILTANPVPELTRLNLPIIGLKPEQQQTPVHNLANVSQSNHLAYVCYTSGSTGQPKGVCVPHRAVLNLVCGTDYVKLKQGDRIAQLATPSFDAATFELWGALLNGASLYLINKQDVLSVDLFATKLKKHKINTLFLTTALLNQLIQQQADLFASMKQVLFGGEAANPMCIRRLMKHAPERLVHVYGPTEATTFTTWHEITHVHDPIPIGRAIANTYCYVLDRRQMPVPIGVEGELYIGGAGLALGYLNREELNAAHFIADPFSRTPSRLYRTGDRVHYLENGDLVFLGRFDHQIKLRGFRVEPGEVEAALEQYHLLTDNLVVSHNDEKENKQLVAYLIVPPSKTLEIHKLREFLAQRLPDYMIPRTFVTLDSFPLNANGKIDRAALPDPVHTHTNIERVSTEPQNQIQLHLKKIWEDILNVKAISIDDNFFALGGHSLLAVQLAYRVEKAFGRRLPLDSLWFHGTTINTLSQLLENDKCDWPTLVEIKKAGDKPSLFCVHTMGGNLFHYYELAHQLDSEQGVYGLQARGVYGNQAPRSCIRAIAADCIETMMQYQSSGPYRIAGYSSAGLVAFEMAQQLKNKGIPVKLILLDSLAPKTDLKRKLPERLHALAKQNSLRNLQERLYYSVLKNLGLARLRHFQNVGEAHRWAHWSYKAKPFAGKMELFVCSETLKRTTSPDLGWTRLASAGIKIHQLPGSHNRMLKGPTVTLLAKKLQKYLDLYSTTQQ